MMTVYAALLITTGTIPDDQQQHDWPLVIPHIFIDPISSLQCMAIRHK